MISKDTAKTVKYLNGVITKVLPGWLVKKAITCFKEVFLSYTYQGMETAKNVALI